MNANSIRISPIIALSLALAGPVWGGDRTFYDFAPVEDAMPIVKTMHVPVRREVCETVAVTEHVPPAGNVRELEPHTTLAEAIRADIAASGRPDSTHRCRTVVTTELEEKLIGYDVTYRYGGRLYVRRLSYDPGERVRVKVEIKPSW